MLVDSDALAVRAMKKQNPPPLPHWPEGPVKSRDKPALVGGFPWAETALNAQPLDSNQPLVRTQPQRIPSILSPLPETVVEDPFSWPALKLRFQAIVRSSPAWTVSLAVHILLLLILTLFVVHQQKPERLRLDMAFSLTPGEPAIEEGVQIIPTEEPSDMTEVVETELPPVAEPIAAPPTVAVVEESGVTAAAAPAIAIGSALNGREVGQKKALLGAFGGGEATEVSVAMALQWLAKQQQPDGLWNLQGPYENGGSQENRLAATAMALLAFQGAGNTTTTGAHRTVVARGWKSLLAKQEREGNFIAGSIPLHHSLYSHAQATIALCEIYGMSQDESFAQPALQSLAFALAAQGPNGAWRYEPGKDGDMSVTGWFLMALKTAQMAGMKVPQSSFDAVERFLDSVALDKGSRYGYRRDNANRPPGPTTTAISAEGLLCREYLGWAQNDPRLLEGVELLMAEKPFDYENDKDVYAWYYITQVTHHLQGSAWDRWNAQLREVLPSKQVVNGREKGSWDPSLDKWGPHGGRLFVTCMCTFMLEVYYRHMPIYAAP